ncbi:MAG: iron ABC transporter permease [Synergistetes bacterium]|nr:iron ABC transporter permease [Synergistota bacterium]
MREYSLSEYIVLSEKRFFLVVFTLLVLLCVSLIAYTGMGYMPIPSKEVWSIIYQTLVGRSVEAKAIFGKKWYIVMEVRLPRILCSALVGTALSICGVVYQGVLLNPLADPYTLGVSASASFGAALALVFDLESYFGLSIQLVAFLFAVIALALVMKMSTFKGFISPTSLILSGVIIGAIFSAGLSFMKYLAGEEVGSIIFWLMGSFASRSWNDVLILVLFTLVAFPVFLLFARDLNSLSMGDRCAYSLGVDPSFVRMVLLVVSSLLVAVSVSISGIIGFVGIIVPHIFRFIVGPDNKKLLVVSAIGGALFLATADNASRVWLPMEVPIGVLTAIAGGPFFAIVFRRKTFRGESPWAARG